MPLFTNKKSIQYLTNMLHNNKLEYFSQKTRSRYMSIHYELEWKFWLGFWLGGNTTHRDVSVGATGATAVAPKFSDTLTLFQPGGEDYAHHWRGRTEIFPVITSLFNY